MWDGIVSAYDWTAGKVSGAYDWAADGISSVFSSDEKEGKKTTEASGKESKGLFSSMWDGIVSAYDWTASKVKGAYNRAVDGISSVFSSDEKEGQKKDQKEAQKAEQKADQKAEQKADQKAEQTPQATQTAEKEGEKSAEQRGATPQFKNMATPEAMAKAGYIPSQIQEIFGDNPKPGQVPLLRDDYTILKGVTVKELRDAGYSEEKIQDMFARVVATHQKRREERLANSGRTDAEQTTSTQREETGNAASRLAQNSDKNITINQQELGVSRSQIRDILKMSRD